MVTLSPDCSPDCVVCRELGGNNISRLELGLSKAASLASLSLQHNHISSLPPAALASLPRLSIL